MTGPKEDHGLKLEVNKIIKKLFNINLITSIFHKTEGPIPLHDNYIPLKS